MTAGFRRANPQTDAELLEWYRTTEAYIWELSSYHLDPGFNYAGMCEGIAVRLKNDGCKSILCLGDGIGDLSLMLSEVGDGAFPIYHDLKDSRTAAFARFRDKKRLLAYFPSDGWEFPRLGLKVDAVVSLDYLEHCIDVPGYLLAIYQALKPGGLLMTQNAFGCGSGPDGSMPMHLARNDRFVTGWDPLLSNIGFAQESSNWYRKPL